MVTHVPSTHNSLFKCIKTTQCSFQNTILEFIVSCFLALIVLSPSSSTGSSNVLTVRTRHFVFSLSHGVQFKVLHGTVSLFHFYCSKIHISQNLPVSLFLRTQSGGKYLHNVVKASPNLHFQNFFQPL